MTLSPVTMFHRLMGLSSFFLTFPLGRRAFGKLAAASYDSSRERVFAAGVAAALRKGMVVR
eukprot:CAMPEP_0119507400 /NCGR_PEP_ID=MMETSP1344-20130328/27304_1 /TAXON_ID=236787 /ORGANISM="Florenciella parvula, Strain CCMP2471" /LENGTH=60 /DNA_ID=CAMNT_0007544027 /DNA_START=446 /DNA_END=625 /DNA_ORIENTATION=+